MSIVNDITGFAMSSDVLSVSRAAKYAPAETPNPLEELVVVTIGFTFKVIPVEITSSLLKVITKGISVPNLAKVNVSSILSNCVLLLIITLISRSCVSFI